MQSDERDLMKTLAYFVCVSVCWMEIWKEDRRGNTSQTQGETEELLKYYEMAEKGSEDSAERDSSQQHR